MFVVVNQFGNCWERMFLGEVVKSLGVLSYVIMFHHASVDATSTTTDRFIQIKVKVVYSC